MQKINNIFVVADKKEVIRTESEGSDRRGRDKNKEQRAKITKSLSDNNKKTVTTDGKQNCQMGFIQRKREMEVPVPPWMSVANSLGSELLNQPEPEII